MIRFALFIILFGMPVSVAAGNVPHSYQGAEDIDAVAAKLRRAAAEAPSHSFSRAWFEWELRRDWRSPGSIRGRWGMVGRARLGQSVAGEKRMARINPGHLGFR